MKKGLDKYSGLNYNLDQLNEAIKRSAINIDELRKVFEELDEWKEDGNIIFGSCKLNEIELKELEDKVTKSCKVKLYKRINWEEIWFYTLVILSSATILGNLCLLGRQIIATP